MCLDAQEAGAVPSTALTGVRKGGTVQAEMEDGVCRGQRVEQTPPQATAIGCRDPLTGRATRGGPQCGANAPAAALAAAAAAATAPIGDGDSPGLASSWADHGSPSCQGQL